ncbi:hypothetical protein [Clostridioides sp. ES-S-0123-01]
MSTKMDFITEDTKKCLIRCLCINSSYVFKHGIQSSRQYMDW